MKKEMPAYFLGVDGSGACVNQGRFRILLAQVDGQRIAEEMGAGKAERASCVAAEGGA